MADLRIVDAPVLLQESITDDVKMPTGGLGNFSVRLGDILWYVITKEQLANKNYVDLSSKSVKDSLDVHIADKANPHQVTKEQVGLGNVDNTADVDKPVSNATKSTIITATTDMATKTYVNQKDNLKADKATTLSGYGITDAYTKDETYSQIEIDGALTLKADVAYVDGKDGDLTKLTTNDKTNLVKAINELHDNTSGLVTLYDKNLQVGEEVNGWADLLVTTASGRNQRDKNSDILSVKDFGAKGDGVTDDTMSIQDAVEYAINNKKNLYFPTASYAISKTILIPCLYNPSFKKNYNLTIDGNNSNFVMLNDVTLFESGYYDNGVLKSNLGTPLVTYNTFGLVLENFYITSKDGAWLLSPALKIQDWHQGCKIQRISSSVNATLLYSYGNFYCQFYMMSGSSSAGKTGERFIFESSHNLCKFDTLVAVDAVIGYWFKGELTACQITNLSFEGHTNSIVFDNYVYDVTIENCYAENVSDSVITFNSYAFSVYINNNYVNYVEHEDEMWFINFTKKLPGNNVVITETNYFSIEDRLFKNATPDDSSMAGVKVVKPRINGNINTLLVDNTKYSKFLNYQQTAHLGGAISNVVNQYAVGNYAGKYSNGYGSPTGFVWVNLNGKNIQLDTKITPSATQRIYVNIVVSTATISTFIRGEFIGEWAGAASFWQFKDDGTFGKTTILSVSTDANGFIRITGANTASDNVVSVLGEVRLI